VPLGICLGSLLIIGIVLAWSALKRGSPVPTPQMVALAQKAAAKSRGVMCVSFQAAAGQRYRVYKSPSIDAPFASWVQIGPEISGADAPVQVDYTPQAGESSLFLRALVEFQ
jgi:hypothetical protein